MFLQDGRRVGRVCGRGSFSQPGRRSLTGSQRVSSCCREQATLHGSRWTGSGTLCSDDVTFRIDPAASTRLQRGFRNVGIPHGDASALVTRMEDVLNAD